MNLSQNKNNNGPIPFLPDILKPYEERIRQLHMHYADVSCDVPEKGEELAFTASKLLGAPYMPPGFSVPADKEGRPMLLFAQINFAEVPPLEDYPESGILQFYMSLDNLDTEQCYVVYHEHIDAPSQPYTAPFTQEEMKAAFFPVACEHKLTFSRDEEYGNYRDFRTQDFDFDGRNMYDYEDFLEENGREDEWEEIRDFFNGAGHKIGGYAYFTQDDPRTRARNGNDVLLLQIDEDAHIQFGDSGISHFFIDRDALHRKDFSKAYFHWDCY